MTELKHIRNQMSKIRSQMRWREERIEIYKSQLIDLKVALRELENKEYDLMCELDPKLKKREVIQ